MRQPSRFSEVGFESMKMGVFLLFGRTKRPDLHRNSPPAFFAAFRWQLGWQDLVASRYPPAVAPIRDRAAAFQTSTLDRTEPRRILSCWSLRCQVSHANLING